MTTKPPTPRALAIDAVLCALDAMGFVPMGQTAEQTVRIPTMRAPVRGGGGGELRTLGGRARFGLPGTDLRVTVGKMTTFVYRVVDKKTVGIAHHDTLDQEEIAQALREAVEAQG